MGPGHSRAANVDHQGVGEHSRGPRITSRPHPGRPGPMGVGPTIGPMSSRPPTGPRSLAATGALLCALALTSCSGDASESAVDTGGAGDTGGAPASTTSCAYHATGSPAKQVEPPPAEAPDTGEASAVIATNAGDVDITLDQEATPCTVNSFVSLADQGYFDN